MNIKIDHSKKTVRDIHLAVLSTTDLKNAAKTLQMAGDTLGKLFAKITYTDETGKHSLTYELMKTWDEDKARRLLGFAYDQPVSTKRIDINAKTLKEIHGVIIMSHSSNDAANKLGIHLSTLKNHLANVFYEDIGGVHVLTYETLKSWDEQKASTMLGSAYNQHLPPNKINTVKKIDQTEKIDISRKTVREVHAAIRLSSSLKDAARELKVGYSRLRRCLIKIPYEDAEGAHLLTYETLKEWDERKAKTLLGDIYDNFIPIVKVDISKIAVKEVHQVITSSTSLADAADKLGIYVSTLGRGLGKIQYEDADGTHFLTYEMLNSWDEKKARTMLGFAYDDFIPSGTVDLTQRTVRELHQVIRSSSSLKNAADELGITSSTLSTHLGKMTYIDFDGKHSLTYNVLKSWDDVKARTMLGNVYDQFMITKKVDIYQKTVKEIHQVIFTSHSLNDAASKLGIRDKTLVSHLAKFNYEDVDGSIHPLTYAVMKSWNDEKQVISMLKIDYLQPMVSAIKKIRKKSLPSSKALNVSSVESNENTDPDLFLNDPLEAFNIPDPYVNNPLEESNENTDPDLSFSDPLEAFNNPEPNLDHASEEFNENMHSDDSFLNDLFVENAGITLSNTSCFHLFSKKRRLEEEQLTETKILTLNEVAEAIQTTSSEDEAANTLETTLESLKQALLELGITYSDIKNDTPEYQQIKDDFKYHQLFLIDTSSAPSFKSKKT